ncbi:MAG TPA: bifunctional UDP-sugar hydrolase/5'-nucleotidase, partial [Kofleriaceae bacterium]|nr:bifunctional UDP-sugar hydrolase/5'-nucleotidase [Kofleriaceae bacterium]
MLDRGALIAMMLAVSCCGKGGQQEPAPAPKPDEDTGTVMISVVGTNDLHGHLEALPVLAGYLRNLRAARARDGGAVLVLDAGDMFQGTLESNPNEGAMVIRAYSALGYTAATIGNHEFDFGPVGEAATAGPGEEPRGALEARAAEAAFPLLMANIVETASGEPPDWRNVEPSAIVEAAGVRVGLIGVTTMATPYTTMAANFAGLRMVPIAEAVARRAVALRKDGAQAVIVVAHAGAACRDLEHPRRLESCDADAEIFEVARALPRGAVDAIVAGHTHQAVAHIVNEVPIIESYAYGRAFGRLDLLVDRGTGAVRLSELHAPRDLCSARPPAPCEPGPYEGAAVAPDPAIAAMIEPAFAAARERKAALLGVVASKKIRRAGAEESALGNLFVDLMRQARPDADVAITNGGGLRADLPEGPLTYGALYEAMPFDNRFARITMTGAELAQVVGNNLGRSRGIFSLGGVRATARCKGKTLEVTLVRDSGAPVRDAEVLQVITSDFLASGGDGAFGGVGLAPGAIELESGETIRDAMASALRTRGGALDPHALYDPKRPRLR